MRSPVDRSESHTPEILVVSAGGRRADAVPGALLVD